MPNNNPNGHNQYTKARKAGTRAETGNGKTAPPAGQVKAAPSDKRDASQSRH